jgi:hypothetical protein
MMYEVVSARLGWPVGAVLSTDDLSGCNIEHLVATGHLAPAATTKKKAEPVQPEPVDYDSADEPEEQE